MDASSPQEWINATELRIAKIVEQIHQSADVLASMAQEMADLANTLHEAKRFQLGFVPVQPESVSQSKTPAPSQPSKPRQSFRSVMAQMVEDHGEEVANFVMGNMLGASRTVESVQKAMKTFLGTFDSPVDAAEAFAQRAERTEDDPFEVMAMARYRLIHADGRVSIWSNFIAPGDVGDVDQAEGRHEPTSQHDISEHPAH